MRQGARRFASPLFGAFRENFRAIAGRTIEKRPLPPGEGWVRENRVSAPAYFPYTDPLSPREADSPVPVFILPGRIFNQMRQGPRKFASPLFGAFRENFRTNAPRTAYLLPAPFPARPGEFSSKCTKNREFAPAAGNRTSRRFTHLPTFRRASRQIQTQLTI